MNREKSSEKSIYLGDIDPNNHIISPIEVRRNILFQLLIWDSIVLSDSQYLTDPRIHLMMSDFADDKICEEYGIQDVYPNQKGFEHLIRAGLVEIACRENSHDSFSFSKLWTRMSQKDTKDVPYLPHTPDYARYLDELAYQGRTYNLSSIGDRFKSNLLKGVERGGLILSRSSDTDMELKRLFHEDTVLFRNLLDFLQHQLKMGIITQHRYDEIYQYIYSCYSVNISAETGCNISTKFKNIPFHLESGDGACREDFPQMPVERLRPTWSLAPQILDIISFEDFVEIRRTLQPVFHNGILMKFYKGSVESKDWGEVQDVWEEYTITLEKELKLRMYQSDHALQKAYINEFGNKSRYIKTPKQEALVAPGLELVKSIVSYIPIIGDVISAVDAVSAFHNAIYCLTKRKARTSLLEQKKMVEDFIDGNTRIITRYGDD